MKPAKQQEEHGIPDNWLNNFNESLAYSNSCEKQPLIALLSLTQLLAESNAPPDHLQLREVYQQQTARLREFFLSELRQVQTNAAAELQERSASQDKLLKVLENALAETNQINEQLKDKLDSAYFQIDQLLKHIDLQEHKIKQLNEQKGKIKAQKEELSSKNLEVIDQNQVFFHDLVRKNMEFAVQNQKIDILQSKLQAAEAMSAKSIELQSCLQILQTHFEALREGFTHSKQKVHAQQALLEKAKEGEQEYLNQIADLKHKIQDQQSMIATKQCEYRALERLMISLHNDLEEQKQWRLNKGSSMHEQLLEAQLKQHEDEIGYLKDTLQRLKNDDCHYSRNSRQIILDSRSATSSLPKLQIGADLQSFKLALRQTGNSNRHKQIYQDHCEERKRGLKVKSRSLKSLELNLKGLSLGSLSPRDYPLTTRLRSQQSTEPSTRISFVQQNGAYVYADNRGGMIDF